MNYKTVDLKKTGTQSETICRENGYNAIEIASSLNVSHQSVYKWFSGKSLPTLDNVLFLSQLLKVRVEDFIVYEEVTYPSFHIKEFVDYVYA